MLAVHCMVTRPPTPTDPITPAAVTSPTGPWLHSGWAGQPTVDASLTVNVALPDRAWLESEMFNATSAALEDGAPAQAPQPEKLSTIPSAGRFPIQIPLRLAVGGACARELAGGPADIGVNGVTDPASGPQPGQSDAPAARTRAHRVQRVMAPQV